MISLKRIHMISKLMDFCAIFWRHLFTPDDLALPLQNNGFCEGILNQ